jgi:Ca-activated chloride channel family protein
MDGRRNKVTNSSDAKPLFTLPEGEYLIRATRGNSTVEKVISIKEGEGIQYVFNLNVGNLKLSALASETSVPFTKFLDVNYYVYTSEKDMDGHRKKITNSSDAFPLFKLLAGQYFVVASRGNATAEATIEVKAGEMITHRFNLNTGNLKLQALPRQGAKAFVKFLAVDYQVYSEKTDRDGNYIKVTNSSDAKPLFKLAAGKYIIVAMRKDTGIKVEIKLEIKAGELLEHTLVISESAKVTATNPTAVTSQ